MARISGRGLSAIEKALRLRCTLSAADHSVVGVSAVFLMHPPRSDQHLLYALVTLLIADLAWFVAWSTDRQIELARKMTYRVAPARTLRALLPIIATAVAIVFVAARS